MVAASPLASAGVLDRSRTVADSHYNRWLVPPAALAIHLCIGMAYGFSVFWLPMSRLLPGAAACPSLAAALTATACNWTVPQVTHVFETFIAMLGLSAAIGGGWLERAGPRRAGFLAACCWGGGLILGGVGVWLHQLWLVFLGCGLIGGIGQGLGYITPVSTLIRWFPDRRGMATGFAIMGYGGGAMVGAPLAAALMARFGAGGTPAVATALMVMGVIYFLAMTAGAFGFRVAPEAWRPGGWVPPPAANSLITAGHVHVDQALRTPQFWLIWLVLLTNVTAGIAVISMASPMLQDVFGGRLLGLASPAVLDAGQKAAVAAAAAGLVGLISLFNSLGRLFWASLSDLLGRKMIYGVFFALGIGLYCLLPRIAHHGTAALFVAAICLIITLYGGGFACLPAYLADIFGTRMVGAIHGRLITAWSVAGVAGPMLIAGLRQSQLQAGVPRAFVYDRTLYVMAGLLLVGLASNLLVRPVSPTHFMRQHEPPPAPPPQPATIAPGQSPAIKTGAAAALAWLAVGVPFGIGLIIALRKAAALL